MKNIIYICLILTFCKGLKAQTNELDKGSVYVSENMIDQNISFKEIYPTPYFRIENKTEDKIYVKYKLQDPFMNIIFKKINGEFVSSSKMLIAPYGRVRLICKLYIVNNSMDKKIILKTYNTNQILVNEETYILTHIDAIDEGLNNDVYFSEMGFSPFD